MAATTWLREYFSTCSRSIGIVVKLLAAEPFKTSISDVVAGETRSRAEIFFDVRSTTAGKVLQLLYLTRNQGLN